MEQPSNENIEINILVVDDDQICLNIIAQYLQKMNHHVVAMKNPFDALFTLQMNRGSFDLVLTDVHMPQMSGLQLLKHAREEFQLPVVLMSADYDKNMMLRGLEDGASFYLVKPITQKSLTKLWQFTISSRTNSSPRSTLRVEQEMHIIGSYKNDNNIGSLFTTSVEDHKGDTIISNQIILKRTNADINGVKVNPNKKPKLIWTTSLHNLFLEAVNKIGLEKAVPKKILECMNVPGLRRENVASHLQKYRIFLKRIYETSNYSENGVPCNWNERPLRSSFVLNEITYLANNFQQQYQELLTQIKKVKHDDTSSKDQQEVPTKVTNCIGEGSFHDKTLGNFKIGNILTNYVGFRISTNGELVGSFNGMSTNNNHGGDNTTIITSDQEVNNDVSANNNCSQNASLPSFGMNDVIHEEANNNEASLTRTNNVNVYISDFDLGSLFEAPQEMLSDPKEPFGVDFGSFHVLDNGLESFEGFDQGLFLNDDTSFENYYASEYGQQCSEQDNQDGNFNI